MRKNNLPEQPHGDLLDDELRDLLDMLETALNARDEDECLGE